MTNDLYINIFYKIRYVNSKIITNNNNKIDNFSQNSNFKFNKIDTNVLIWQIQQSYNLQSKFIQIYKLIIQITIVIKKFVNLLI